MTDTYKEWLDAAMERMTRIRAHEIWVQEGKPEGRAREHWLRAEMEVQHTLMRSERSLLVKMFAPKKRVKK